MASVGHNVLNLKMPVLWNWGNSYTVEGICHGFSGIILACAQGGHILLIEDNVTENGYIYEKFKHKNEKKNATCDGHFEKYGGNFSKVSTSEIVPNFEKYRLVK